MCIIKLRLLFEEYKNCLQNNEIILKSQKRFKSELHNILTEKVNTILLTFNDDKRVQSFNRVKLYPYGVLEKYTKKNSY